MLNSDDENEAAKKEAPRIVFDEEIDNNGIIN